MEEVVLTSWRVRRLWGSGRDGQTVDERGGGAACGEDGDHRGRATVVQGEGMKEIAGRVACLREEGRLAGRRR